MSVKETLASLAASCADMQNKKKESDKRLSEIEQEVSDCYHQLELLNLNAVEMMAVTVRLRKALRVRREVKNDQRYFASLHDNMVQVSNKIRDIEKNISRDVERYKKESEESFKIIQKKLDT